MSNFIFLKKYFLIFPCIFLMLILSTPGLGSRKLETDPFHSMLKLFTSANLDPLHLPHLASPMETSWEPRSSSLLLPLTKPSASLHGLQALMHPSSWKLELHRFFFICFISQFHIYVYIYTHAWIMYFDHILLLSLLITLLFLPIPFSGQGMPFLIPWLFVCVWCVWPTVFNDECLHEHGWGHLLDQRQLTSGYATEGYDSSFPCHQLTASRGGVGPHEPLPSVW